MSAIITSFFSDRGTPTTSLTPTIDIWEVTPLGDTLVINNNPMDEIAGGFYKFVFGAYDPTKDYAFKADGGNTLREVDRYNVGVSSDNSIETANAVWQVDTTTLVTPDTTGLCLNQIKADTTQLRLDVEEMKLLIELLLKFETNRTRIDKIAKTLTIYDDDGVTPLHVFQLKDGSGAHSVSQVCERDPI